MLNLNDFAKEVYQVAVEHGWYENEENRDVDTKIALIHSEWSEALEEYRAGRPMVWYECKEIEHSAPHACDPKDLNDCLNYEVQNTCPHRGKKPEGIAIELIDGCIRILDFIGYQGWMINEACDTIDKLIGAAEFVHSNFLGIRCKNISLPTLIRWTHWYTAEYEFNDETGEPMMTLLVAAGLALLWIKNNGCDPEDLLCMKHEYNKTRPYKHGGKRC